MKQVKIRFFLIFAFLVFVGNKISFAQDTLNLSELLAILLENNYQIRLARNTASINAINNTLGTAGFSPVVDISGDGTKSVVNASREFYDGRTQESSEAKNQSLSAIAEINWTIFDGTRMFVTKNRLSELEKQGEISLRIQIEYSYLQLASAYYQLIQENKLLEILKITTEISRRRLNLAEKKFSIGSFAETDLLQARLDMSTDSSAVLSQEVKVKNLLSDINVLTGRQPSLYFNVDNKIEIDKNYNYELLDSSLENQNSGLLLARNNENINRLNLKETYASFLPEISLFSNYNYLQQNNESGQLIYNKNYGLNYGLRFSYNIFNGFNYKRQTEISRIEYESAQLQTDELLNSLKGQLYKSYNIYVAALKTYELEKANLVDARKSLQIGIELYKRGAINEIDFRETQLKSIRAESSLLVAEFLSKMAELDLEKLSGTLKFE